jgi:hypothetical protein
MARWLASAGFLTLLGAGFPASAAPPEVQVQGPYCTPAGCPGAPRSALGTAGGFALTGAAALLLARRRDSKAA